MSVNGPYARRTARRLKNLRISSVDSVDRGAGEGVQVLLMKRDDRHRDDGYAWACELAHRQFEKRQQQTQENSTMRTTNDQVIAKFMKGVPRVDGDPNSALDQLIWQQEIVKMARQNPKMTDAIFSAAARREYLAKQHAGALGDGYQVAKKMADAAMRKAATAGEAESQGGDGEPLTDAEKELHAHADVLQGKMKRAGVNWSHDQCVEHVKASDRGQLLMARDRAARNAMGR